MERHSTDHPAGMAGEMELGEGSKVSRPFLVLGGGGPGGRARWEARTLSGSLAGIGFPLNPSTVPGTRLVHHQHLVSQWMRKRRRTWLKHRI